MRHVTPPLLDSLILPHSNRRVNDFIKQYYLTSIVIVVIMESLDNYVDLTDYLTLEVAMHVFWVVLALAIVIKTLVDYLTRPFKLMFQTPKEKRKGEFWLSFIKPYISFVIGGLVCGFAKLDIFSGYMPDAPHILTLGLTSVLAGGGASLIHDILKSLVKYTALIKDLLPAIVTNIEVKRWL